MRAVTLIGLVLVGLALCTPAWADWTQEDEGQCRATGLFVNSWYGFSVPIPPGLHGCPNSPIEMSDHGVIIPLSQKLEDGHIECYAAYNVLFYKNAAESAKVDSDNLAERAAAHSILVMRRTKTHLGDLPAVRTVTRYVDKKSGVSMTRDLTTAVRHVTPSDPLPSHEYSVVMAVPTAQYARDVSILHLILAKWATGPALEFAP